MQLENGKKTPPIKILIVEDLPLYMLSIKTLLEIAPDFQIIGDADDGNKAVEKTQDLRPNVVLMDIGLPEMSGIDATRAIKENYPDTKVIILTSHLDENEVIECLEAGADAYVLKDTPTDILLTMIKSIRDGAFWLDPKVAAIIRNKRPEMIHAK